MATVRVGKSVKYGAKFFAFVLVVLVVGGGALALGLTLAVPEVDSVVDPSIADDSVFAGGAVLAFFGLTILLSGLFGLFYKLVADAVSEGVATERHPDRTAAKPGRNDEQQATGEDASSGGDADKPETSADEWTETPSESSASGETPTGDSTPREPTPAEIAFGSDSQEETADSERASEPAVSSSEPAGKSSSDDPLADPADDE